MRTRHVSGRAIWTGCSLLLLLCAWLVPAPRVAGASAEKVTAFYACTKADYDKRTKNIKFTPAKHASLASGSVYIAFYYSWSGATAKTSGYYVVLRHHKGATIDVYGLIKVPYADGSSMTWFSNFGHAWPAGTYDADLILDDRPLATTSVTIGGTGASASGSASSATAGGVTISTFITTTQKALKPWWKQKSAYPLPATTSHYPSGTATVWFCLVYKGATPKVTTVEVTVTGPNGLKLTDNGPYKLTAVSQGLSDSVAAPQHLAFPNGSYSAVLLIDGKQMTQTGFTIS